MHDTIKGLLADITIRIPRSRIVLVNSDYYLINDANERTHIRSEDIEMLIGDGYLERNPIGGVTPTVKAIDGSDEYYVKKQIPGLHGKPMDVAEFPYHYS